MWRGCPRPRMRRSSLDSPRSPRSAGCWRFPFFVMFPRRQSFPQRFVVRCPSSSTLTHGRTDLGRQVRQARPQARPVRIELPFQTVETVNEIGAGARSARWISPRQGNRPRVAQPPHLGRQEIRPAVAAPRVRRQGEPDLHRPPVRHRRRTSRSPTTIPESDESFTKESNMWSRRPTATPGARGLDSYLQWFYETAVCCASCWPRMAASTCIWIGM